MTRAKFFTRLGEVYIPWLMAYVAVCYVFTVSVSNYSILDCAVIGAVFWLWFASVQEKREQA